MKATITILVLAAAFSNLSVMRRTQPKIEVPGLNAPAKEEE